ncbi:unnamed protein product [Diatraea saccharalis]|uniref:FLYWCH-type domain-containing protein n=1 Tax=Diatraea saccharalis TaxID=40085 RepID=A0A9N9R1B4_9NEOP|nr:unnamed protein product [Diatraea saccharalis]
MTNKGKVMLIHNGERYWKNYQNGDRVSWICCNRRSCNARVTTVGADVVAFKNEVLQELPERRQNLVEVQHSRLHRAHINVPEESVEYYFAKSKFGNPVLVMGCHRYKFMKARGVTATNKIKFEMTRFGNPIITWGKHRFIKKLSRRVKTWWECTGRKRFGCRCVVVTVDDRLIKMNGWHNH